MQSILEQISSLTLSSIDISLVIVLLAIGWICKHAFKFISNEIIPVIVVVAGIVIAILQAVPFNVQDALLTLIIKGFASGYVATMVHSNGKNIIQSFTPGDSLSDQSDDADEN